MVTAVLIKYKRPEETEIIADELRRHSNYISEVLIRDNTKENLISYGRYVEAEKAKNSIIYVQDDDCRVDYIDNLIAHFMDIGHFVNYLKPSHFDQYKDDHTMVGWGAVFHKSDIKVLDQYKKVYGEDAVLKREADRIFTTLLAYKRSFVGSVKDFPSANSENALYKQPDHDSMKWEAINRARHVIGLNKI